MNKILCTDNVKGMATLPSNSIPLTVCSPPYDNLRDFAPWDFEQVAKQLFRVTEQGGIVCWQVRDAIKKRYSLTSFKQAIFFESIGFDVWEILIIKMSSDQLPTGRRYIMNISFCFVLSKGRPNTVNLLRDKVNKHAGNMKRTWQRRSKDGTMRKGTLPKPIAPFGRRSVVWEYASGKNGTTKDDVFAHKALMPEKLARDLILSFSSPYDCVLDPFMGAGTTAKMAMLTGRRWIGFEIEPDYVRLANARLSKAEKELLPLKQGDLK